MSGAAFFGHFASEIGIALYALSSITDRTVDWPTFDQWLRVLTLRDYNTRVVVIGTLILGAAAGVIGSFTLLRKRALMGDALSHATLPGIGLAFMISVAAGGSGKSLGVLLLGATISGVIGLGAVLAIRNLSRLKEDTALGIVLSVFFGTGVAVLGIAQRMGEGHSAGLESFIYGKTASMVTGDALLIGVVAAFVVAASILLFKEFRLLAFDTGYASSQGWPTVGLDIVMMALVVAITVVGLQAVGLILVIALLIIPAAAARFWTERLDRMVPIAAAIGALSCGIGSTSSALFAHLPSGAMIVIAAGMGFLFSMLFGSARGILVRSVRRFRLNRKVRRQHLLRAMYELNETARSTSNGEMRPEAFGVGITSILPMRSWSRGELQAEIRSAISEGLAERAGDEVRLTPEGSAIAARTVRNHRLWELYLITYADIAPSHVDRDADMIEHVLGTDLVRELETLLHSRDAATERLPPSPHALSSTSPVQS